VNKTLPTLILISFIWCGFMCTPSSSHIDRQALVQRHLPTLNAIDPLSPFSIGNGEFAFTADVTGLQTIPDSYESGIPLVTQSHWGWHSIPNTEEYREEQTWEYFDTYGRNVPYASIMNSKPAQHFRANPHRLHLGRIGFKRVGDDVTAIESSDITNIHQVMDIWHGVIKSSFVLDGRKLRVETCVHPTKDIVAAKIESEEFESAALGVGFDFPYGSLQWGKTAYDWNRPELHTSIIIDDG